MNIIISLFFWLITALLTLGVFLADLLIAVFLFPFDRKKKLAHAQGFWWADIIVGMNPFWSVEVKGMENADRNKVYVIVANHNSLADIVMLYNTHLQFKWVAKEVLFKVPVFGWCMSLMGYIKLRRGEFGSIKDTYAQASRWLKEGVSVLFFPEGTRSANGRMGEFKNGAFKLAIKEKIPILPIRIEDSAKVVPRGSWVFKSKARCRVTILPQIDTAGLGEEDFSVLKEEARRAIIQAQN